MTDPSRPQKEREDADRAVDQDASDRPSSEPRKIRRRVPGTNATGGGAAARAKGGAGGARGAPGAPGRAAADTGRTAAAQAGRTAGQTGRTAAPAAARTGRTVA